VVKKKKKKQFKKHIHINVYKYKTVPQLMNNIAVKIAATISHDLLKKGKKQYEHKQIKQIILTKFRIYVLSPEMVI